MPKPGSHPLTSVLILTSKPGISFMQKVW